MKKQICTDNEQALLDVLSDLEYNQGFLAVKTILSEWASENITLNHLEDVISWLETVRNERRKEIERE